MIDITQKRFLITIYVIEEGAVDVLKRRDLVVQRRKSSIHNTLDKQMVEILKIHLLD